jgi:hypothetical protein
VLPDVLYRYRYHVSSATGSAPPGERERVLGTYRMCMREFAAGRSYDAVLEAAEGNGVPPAVADALYQTAAMRLWAGRPPSILKDALTRRVGFSGRAALTLLMALWGSVSASTLRMALGGFVRLRDRLASLWIKEGRAYPWRLP